MADISIPAVLLLQLPKGWVWKHAEQFESVGDSDAYHQADRRLSALGMLTGSMQYPAPTAAFKDSDYVSKWRGLSERERFKMNAVILTLGRADARTCWVLFREMPEIYGGRVDQPDGIG